MFKNYLKIAWRNLLRHKAFSAINIVGLSIGMTCSIFILLWVQHELSYDRFHTNSNRMYRLVCNAGDFKAAVNAAGMPAELKSEMPEIKNTVRISQQETHVFWVGTKKFDDNRARRGWLRTEHELTPWEPGESRFQSGFSGLTAAPIDIRFFVDIGLAAIRLRQQSTAASCLPPKS